MSDIKEVVISKGDASSAPSLPSKDVDFNRTLVCCDGKDIIFTPEFVNRCGVLKASDRMKVLYPVKWSSEQILKFHSLLSVIPGSDEELQLVSPEMQAISKDLMLIGYKELMERAATKYVNDRMIKRFDIDFRHMMELLEIDEGNSKQLNLKFHIDIPPHLLCDDSFFESTNLTDSKNESIKLKEFEKDIQNPYTNTVDRILISFNIQKYTSKISNRMLEVDVEMEVSFMALAALLDMEGENSNIIRLYM